MQWVINPDMRPLAATIGAVARCAFWIATFVGAASWAYGSRHRRPSDYYDGTYSRYLHRFCAVAGVAATALLVSVLADGALATIRLFSTRPSIAFVVPIFAIISELVSAGVLILLICSLARRAIFTADLQKT